MKSVLKKVLAVVAVAFVFTTAHAQSKEDISIVWGFNIGSTQANVLRTMIQELNKSQSKYNFNLVHRLGAGGTIAANSVTSNPQNTIVGMSSSFINRPYYEKKEVTQNLDKFVELDVVKRIGNLINPCLECYAFNYKNNTYLYRCDERYGNSFFKYESALELVNEVRNELNYDLTYFYENKLSKELVVKRKLEDKEREITLKLEDVNFNIEKIKGSIQLIGESEVLTTALKNLEKRSTSLSSELGGVKEIQYKERIKL